jgi:peptidoglycan hydrolase CwlO-like protein
MKYIGVCLSVLLFSGICFAQSVNSESLRLQLQQQKNELAKLKDNREASKQEMALIDDKIKSSDKKISTASDKIKDLCRELAKVPSAKAVNAACQ